MSFRLTIAGKINLFLTLLTVFVSIFASSYMLYREYHRQLDSVIADVIGRSEQGAQQQLAVYFRDTEVLEQLLSDLLAMPAVDYAAVFDERGEVIVDRFGTGIVSYSSTDLFYIRRGRGELELVLSAPNNASGKLGYYDLSTPIFSRVSPHDKSIDRKHYGEVLA
jgi:hypothetical protein